MKNFNTKFLTYRQLRDFLNDYDDEDDVLDTHVVCLEHHHFTYIKCNPCIEERIIDESQNCGFQTKEFEKWKNDMLNQEQGESPLQHERQPSLSLMI